MAINWGQGGAGALTGGLAGAQLGMGFGGPTGAAIGAGVGALGGGAAGLFGGLENPEKLNQYERFSPQQRQVIESVLNMLTGQGQQPGGLLGELGDDSALMAPAMRRFQEQTIPGIAERFSGTGAGSQSSSAFQQSLGAAGASLQENLAKMSADRKMKLVQYILQLAGTPMTDRRVSPATKSAFGEGLGALGQMGAKGIARGDITFRQN